MTFDPFGDFETRGYLRNTVSEKDRAIVQRLEHAAFTTGLEVALKALGDRKTLTYDDLRATRRILFEPIYPWAGQDRTLTAPDLAIRKGDGESRVVFANPADIQRSIDYALKLGQDKAVMKKKPGEVMGYLAHGHPFLDGNGRTILTVHCVLAHRAGIRVDWASVEKTAYLAALTRELDDPGKGHLDAYLEPFVGEAGAQADLAANITAAPGLDGNDTDVVAGKTEDATLKAEYAAKRKKRSEALG